MNTLLLRAVIAFLALPGTFAFIVPLWLAMSGASRRAFNPVSLPVLAAGPVVLMLVDITTTLIYFGSANAFLLSAK